MSQQQPFTKNTNTPDPDSGLWAVGEGWKISQGKGNKTYCPLDRITDQTLGEEMETQLNNETKKPFNYQGYWFVPSAMERDGKLTLLIYAFDNEDAAEQHASYKPMTANSGAFGTQKPKIQFKPKPQQQRTFTPSGPNIVQAPTIPTYTEEQLVRWDDFVKKEELTRDGYVNLPASLISPNVMENKNGELCIWMGKIVNAKIQ